VKNGVNVLANAIDSLQKALLEEVDVATAASLKDMEEQTPADLSARYWLQVFCEPLNRKQLLQIINGFMVPLLNDDQCRKLVKFLLIRFPEYYTEELQQTPPTQEGEAELSKKKALSV
jgi:hypothetical protein